MRLMERQPTSLRLSEAEGKRVRKAARSVGVPVSVWVRMVLLQHLEAREQAKAAA